MRLTRRGDRLLVVCLTLGAVSWLDIVASVAMGERPSQALMVLGLAGFFGGAGILALTMSE